MLKNRYVFWGMIAAWVLVLVGAGSWYWFTSDHSKQTSLRQASAELGAVHKDTSTAGNVNSQTISGATTNTGVTISGGAGGSSNGSSTNASSDLSKLLDPTTFSQYDKYKDAQSASYIELQTGTGAVVTETSQVAVVYKGWLTNGTLFDQSKTTSDGKIQAYSFVEGQHQVIPGWETGLVGAKEGGVRLLIIPPALGYGATGQGPIPGNAVLIFQVQIVQVK
jgi:FKBP-type peptidyl-prolyl cis-trans isomerase